MLARPISLVLTALSAATAWPIFFYDNANCNHYPVFTLDKPPKPNTCNFFDHVDIKAYSGGTEDSVEKLLVYHDAPLCHLDAAHHAYSNHTIANNTNLCVATDIRAYVFIEEILGPVPTPKTPANASSCDNALRVQN